MGSRRRGALVAALIVAFGVLGTVPSISAPSTTDGVVPGEVLVRYRPGASSSRAARAVDARATRRLAIPGWERLTLPAGASVAEAVSTLRGDPAVLEVTPDRVYRATDVPNDTYFTNQWGFRNTGQLSGTPGADVDATTAWNRTLGSTAVTVAVVDTGVAYDHPDLSSQMWSNPGEIAGNGIDDDDDGYVDDVRGWDFVNGDNSPYDENGHGTHVSGIIGARGNDGYGISGIARSVRIMPLRALNAQGYGTTTDIADAFRYAAAHGAKVVNASLAGAGSDPYISAAIGASPGTLFVVAAGNESSNNDSAPVFPCTDTHANVLCIAATDQNDGLASFSNYGKTSVDLAAPGNAIYSTWNDGGWRYASGTSMATPFVAGAAALVWSVNLSRTVSQARAALVSSVDALASLSNKTVTGGRLDVARAVDYGLDPSVTGVARAWAGRAVSSRSVRLSGANLQAAAGVTVSGGGVTVDSFATATDTSLSVTISVDGSAPLGARTITVTGLDGSADSCTGCFTVTRFDDVSPGAFGHGEIDTLAEAAITGGCSVVPALFCPSITVTREQMAAFLIRAMGEEPNLQPYRGLFADVPASDPFAPAVERLSDLGITAGCASAPSRFCPSGAVSRAQMAAFLIRSRNEQGSLQPYRGLFADVSSTNPFGPAIERLYDLGVTGGCGIDPSRYCPGETVTRAQMAIFVVRAFAL